MTKNEFLQGLKEELEGRVTHSAIQENIRYYDDYISQEVLKGSTEEEVTESLGGPRIIARTIVDAAYDTEDRPDGYDEYGSGPAEESILRDFSYNERLFRHRRPGRLYTGPHLAGSCDTYDHMDVQRAEEIDGK